jgi:hypothetical protein
LDRLDLKVLMVSRALWVFRVLLDPLDLRVQSVIKVPWLDPRDPLDQRMAGEEEVVPDLKELKVTKVTREPKVTKAVRDSSSHIMKTPDQRLRPL